MTKRLPMVWLSHLKTEEERIKFKDYILNSTSLWERLGDILAEKIPENNKENYSKASWAYYQADQNGYQRALKEIISILPVDIQVKI